ncbi:hypothetical protein HDU85_005973 [Gaertneriomyces sp. JEL0708]|nr:hypothetical protein HDU85_005973 [Gaertneriomyces sp. JEL0708]
MLTVLSTSPVRGPHGDGKFKLILRQQSLRARMCGFSDTKDRRLIDPPPILQLIFNDGENDILVSHEESFRWICHASLFSADGETDCSLVINPRAGKDKDAEDAPQPKSKAGRDRSPEPSAPALAQEHPRKSFRPWWNDEEDRPQAGSASTPQSSAPSPSFPGPSLLPGPSSAGSFPSFPPPVHSSRFCQSLIGSTVMPCEILEDVNGQEGMFFVFHDLSVRLQGAYRLKFLLIYLNLSVPASERQSVSKATITTDIFEVFPPKSFPGMTESTQLSKCFARQGVPIHIRKDYSHARVEPVHGPPVSSTSSHAGTPVSNSMPTSRSSSIVDISLGTQDTGEESLDQAGTLTGDGAPRRSVAREGVPKQKTKKKAKKDKGKSSVASP